jgi:tRNA-specific 2-thiouridylase
VNAKRQKVIVAMSGGVDSSVAAGLLLEAGYDLTGVFLCLGAAGRADGESRGCCSPQDAADARRVANALGIDLYVLNLAEQFGRIVDYFTSEHLRGRTPNPCIHCNSWIKFGRLMDHADSLGVRYVATGHYARIVPAADGPAIARGLAREKDQSYALLEVPRGRLSRMLLPIGELPDKPRVRRIARRLGLAVHDKPDSQEICFVPDDDRVAFLRERCPQALRPGQIVDSTGKVLGLHDGYARFTVGQRRGTRIGGMGVPMYVTHVDAAAARVTVGPKAEVMSSHLRASAANWHRELRESFEATVQIRYNHRGAPGRVRITGPETFEVEFHAPVSAVTPGQAAAVYDGDRLLGGGWID